MTVKTTIKNLVSAILVIVLVTIGSLTIVSAGIALSPSNLQSGNGWIPGSIYATIAASSFAILYFMFRNKTIEEK